MSVHQLKDGRWYVAHRDKDQPKKIRRKYFGRGMDARAKAEEYNRTLSLRPYQENKRIQYPSLLILFCTPLLIARHVE